MNPRRTTHAHEMALGVVFQSGVLHLADAPEPYYALPEIWKRYLTGLPTAWDETRLLAGDPGRYAVLARRKGDRWWIAGINGDGAPRQLELDLSFAKGQQTMLFDDG
ncbi:MAG: glycoside hydrolase family 97 C-terminal domain-containing protein, partial [Verrucomicrobiota bacterium]